MLNFEAFQLIIVVCTTMLAYFPSVTISGYFQAWVATKLGDTSPRAAGFLSFDPFVHTSVIGLLLFLWFRVSGGFGVVFGNRVPVNPRAMSGKHRDLKVLCLYGSPFVSQLALLMVGSACMAAFELYYGIQCTEPAMMGMIVQQFILNFVFINLMLLIISTAFGLLDSVIFFLFGDKQGYDSYIFGAYVIGMLLMMFIIAPYLNLVFFRWLLIGHNYFTYLFRWTCGI